MAMSSMLWTVAADLVSGYEGKNRKEVVGHEHVSVNAWNSSR